MPTSGRSSFLEIAGRRLAVPELVLAGRTSIRRADGPLWLHRHHEAEIHYVEAGASDWRVGDEVHEVEGGDLFIAWPHEPHGGAHGFLNPCSVHWVRLRLDGTGLLGLPSDECELLLSRLHASPRRIIRVGAGALGLFRRIVDGLASPDDDLQSTQVRTALLELLLLIAHAGAVGRPAHSPLVAEAIKLMRTESHEPLTLDEIARRIGYSTPYLKRRFRKEIGVSPGDYALRCRVAAAASQLRGPGVNVTDVAARLGFSSAQYFSAAFRRVVGMSPSRYAGLATSLPADGDDVPYWPDGVLRSASGVTRI